MVPYVNPGIQSASCKALFRKFVFAICKIVFLVKLHISWRYLLTTTSTYRSSFPELFCKKAVLKYFQIHTVKHVHLRVPPGIASAYINLHRKTSNLDALLQTLQSFPGQLLKGSPVKNFFCLIYLNCYRCSRILWSSFKFMK